LQLSRASSLHPRCLALSELQKVGPQVTGGGFGDIWKGLVRGQSVCVKIMRIFEDSNVQALLKVRLSKFPKRFLNVYPGIRSRSRHLAPTVPPERTSLFRHILSRAKAMFDCPLDGQWAHYEIFSSQEPNEPKTSLACKYVFVVSAILSKRSC
jgi:hypothetical protein